MLSCRDVEPIIQDYLDGTILASQREVLDSHLRRCASCRFLLSGFAQIDGRMESLGQVEVPPYLTRSILTALPPQLYAPSRTPRLLKFAFAPALALLLVGLGFLFQGRYLGDAVKGARQVELVFVAPQAASLAVVGDFNGWDTRRNRMVRDPRAGVWRTVLRLPPGIHQYSLVIDDKAWVSDPQAKIKLADGFGGDNSVIIVDGQESL